MKRYVVFVVTLLLGLSIVGPAVAQDGTPEAVEPFVTAPGLGLSEFDITVSDEGFDAPSSIPAGRYLVNLTNTRAEPEAAGFIMPPADWTLEQVQASFAPPESEDAPPPDLSWLYQAKIAGGASAPAGGLGQAVVILSPGRWVIWADNPESALPLAEIQVTGELPATMNDLAAATVTITATSNAMGYDIAVEGDVVAGPQLVKFYNKTDQPHFIENLVSPVALDDDQVMQLLMMGEEATPAPDSGLPAPEEIVPMDTWIPVVSAGGVSWNVIDFASGANILICFVPDPNSPEGLPHSAEGMFEVVEVA